MSDCQRQKLLNWFCTMLLLLLVCTLSLCLSWWRILTYAEIVGNNPGIDWYAGPLGEAFRPYFLFFPLLALWHLFDALEKEREPARWKGWFASYRSFLILLLLASPFAVLSAADGHILSFCYSSFDAGEFGFYDHCYPNSGWTMALWVIAAPLVALAVISKALTAILSNTGAHTDPRSA